MSGISVLGGMSAEVFLRDYWQKKPLLVRGAVPGVASIISADELAGLSLDASVESRLVLEHSDHWELRKGPFADDAFASLPASRWALLVQAVDQHVPDAARLMDSFNFIPNWRVDDLMVSYATDQGGVGPHFDYYDVFIIQGAGRREWRIGQTCDEDSALQPGAPLKLLSTFEQTESWITEPGDLIYIPPGLAHWGIALGECMSLSVGFRALSRLEFIDSFSCFLNARLAEHQRLSDPGRPLQDEPGLLTQASIDHIRNMMKSLLDDDALFKPFLGELLSAPKYDINRDDEPGDFEMLEVLELLENGYDLARDEKSRFLFTRNDQGLDGFYINGEEVTIPVSAEAFAATIGNERYLPAARVRALCDVDAVLGLVTRWLNDGTLYLVEPED